MSKILECDNERCGDHLCRNHDCNNEAEMIYGKHDGKPNNIHSAACTECWKKQSEQYHVDWLGDESCTLEKQELEHYMINHSVECHICYFEFMAQPELNEHRLFEKQICSNCYKDQMGEDYK